jgi:purine-binding chemotaxis protein CheW
VKEVSNNKLQLLSFLLQNMHFCIDLQFIEKVLLLPSLEVVPGGPRYLAGLMNLRGVSIPIIDLALRLGLARDQFYTLSTPILLCFDGIHRAGLLVDKIIGLVEIERDLIQMHAEFEKNHSPFQGVTTLEESLSLLINISRVLEFSLMNGNSDFAWDKNELNSVVKRVEDGHGHE